VPVYWLRTRDDRLRQDQGQRLRQLVLEFPGLPEQAVGEIVATIDRETASANGWTFLMIGPRENELVVRWLLDHSSRPMVAMRVWTACFVLLNRVSQEIVGGRDEIAARASVTPDDVSRVMGELEGVGVIERRRERVPGVRGPGAARYFMNAWVGTCLPGAQRDAQQAKDPPPLLSLVEGGGR